MSRATQFLVGVLIFLVVSLFIIGIAGAFGLATGLLIPTDDSELREYDTSQYYIEKIEADGQVDVQAPTGDDPDPGLILIDDAHMNEFEEGEIQELKAGLMAYGHEVRVVEEGSEFHAELEDAQALVVIDPTSPYGSQEIEAVKEFEAGGGQVMLVGQPDRVEVVGMELRQINSEINSLANALGVNFGSDYLYDMEANDGLFRNVLVESTDHPLMTDVDQGAIYIGTHVSAGEDSQPLLVTHSTAQRSGGETPDTYTVATASDSVLAIGDLTFMDRNTYNVADNERIIEAIVAFLSGVEP